MSFLEKKLIERSRLRNLEKTLEKTLYHYIQLLRTGFPSVYTTFYHKTSVAPQPRKALLIRQKAPLKIQLGNFDAAFRLSN